MENANESELGNTSTDGVGVTESPNFKPVVKNIWEVSILGDSSVRQASSEEEAKVFAKEMEEKAKKGWDEKNSAEGKKQEGFIALSSNIRCYAEHLKKEIWHDSRDENVSKEVIKLKKDIMNTLKGIWEGKINVAWRQNYIGDGTYYTLEDVE